MRAEQLQRQLAPGRVTAIRFQKRNPERVNLYVDGRFAMTLPAVEAAHLKLGQMLSAADLDRLAQVDAQQRAYDKAIRFLSYRPRSISEVHRFLRGKGIDSAISQLVVERLLNAGYLDDESFARWWVENRAQFSPRGEYLLRRELRLKGIAEETIADALTASPAGDSTGAEALWRLAAGRARRLVAEEKASFQRKLNAFLIRRGYGYEESASVVRQLWEKIERAREAGQDPRQIEWNIDGEGEEH